MVSLLCVIVVLIMSSGHLYFSFAAIFMNCESYVIDLRFVNNFVAELTVREFYSIFDVNSQKKCIHIL